MATMDGAKTFTLEAEHELRLEVEHKKTLTVTLLKGTAELFGAELPRDQPLPFTGTKLAIFTWHGATLEVHPSASPSRRSPCPPTHPRVRTSTPPDPSSRSGLATWHDSNEGASLRTRVLRDCTLHASLLHSAPYACARHANPRVWRLVVRPVRQVPEGRKRRQKWARHDPNQMGAPHSHVTLSPYIRNAG
jgi:hypothetical protein